MGYKNDSLKYIAIYLLVTPNCLIYIGEFIIDIVPYPVWYVAKSGPPKCLPCPATEIAKDQNTLIEQSVFHEDSHQIRLCPANLLSLTAPLSLSKTRRLCVQSILSYAYYSSL